MAGTARVGCRMWVCMPLENTCLVCDRPVKLYQDEQNRFHAEGESAIRFVDGYRIYADHGVRWPEKYGLLHPNRWQAEWLLSEENAELRRVLIQGIGYSRICQELQAEELDSWQEYSLLRIDNDIDGATYLSIENDLPQYKLYSCYAGATRCYYSKGRYYLD